ncbi:MAG: cell envelope integrity protein CreD [Desulfobulbaceae bacterium]|nr:cell envelope integrity protein CreD [Desulfobulbaceae bacterium]
MSIEIIHRKFSEFVRNSVSIKIIAIGLLVCVLMIPMSMIDSLIQERQMRRDSVINEISDKWGQEQTIAGPVLTIPYKKHFKDNHGNTSFSFSYMHFLPKKLHISGSVRPEIRYRSIYEVVLYDVGLNFEGTFEYPRFEELGVPAEDIQWSAATLSMGISDMRGIKDSISAIVAEKTISFQPGIDSKDVLDSGVSAKIELPDDKVDFSFKLAVNLNGSHAINFVPIGGTTTVSLVSRWSNPSFSGAFLPNEREITKQGFKASWKILHLNRNYPQQWIGNQQRINSSSFGVKLFIPADVYQKSMRTVKYGFMFIVLTFSAFFFSEISNKKRIHPVQYLMVGFAIIIFYSLLISISEHISYGISYLISSLAIIFLITGYSNGILKSKKLSSFIFVILSTLYGYLYIVLQLEDYALLIGSIGLFLILSAIMYVTRKIDWYDVKFDKLDND